MSLDDELYYTIQQTVDIENTLNTRINILRELDAIIDFARGGLQLNIVMELGRNDDGYTVKDIARILNERPKAVLDAMRKLVVKGLVVKDDKNGYDLYRLSEKGMEFYGRLAKMLGLTEYYRGERVSKAQIKAMVLDIASDLVKYHHIADAVITIATSKNQEASLRTIAEGMKLSVDRAKTYLEMYSENRCPLRLFKKVEKKRSKFIETLMKILNPLLNKIGIKILNNNHMYRLTKEGLMIFYRHPYYVKFKNNLLTQIGSTLFGTLHPRVVIKRATLMVMIVTALALLLSLALPSITPFVLGICIIISTTILTIASITV
ncbi:MAG: hypothetical protein QXH73_02730 [Ignisphaera sp.]